MLPKIRLLEAAGWTPPDSGFSMEDATGTEEIRGVIWNDLDGSGTQDPGEPVLPGHEVYLDLNQNGVRDQAATPWGGLPADGLEPGVVTDADGSYALAGLPPGEYSVAAVVPDGWEMTPTPAVSGGIQRAGVPGIRLDDPDFAGYGMRSSISADGRYMVYGNLITSGTDEVGQIYLFDRDTGQTEMLSIGPDGNPANWDSGNPAISADGRYVVYNSRATNLVDGDINMERDLFLYDRVTGTTERISMADDGSEANESSSSPSISADGRYIAFSTRATNLIAGRNIGDWEVNVYVHDRVTGTNEWLSEGYDGSWVDEWCVSPQISADGRYVAFESLAPNLVPDDTNGVRDIFVHDRQLGTRRRVSVATDGTQGDEDSMFPAISADGQFVTFVSYSSNLGPSNPGYYSRIYVHQLATGVTESISLTDDAGNTFAGNRPSISGDGRYLAVVVDHGSLGILDRVTGLFEKPSGAPDGSRAMGKTFRPTISADGTTVAFSSDGTNLVAGDTNQKADLFVADLTRTWLPGTQLLDLAPGESRLGIDFGIRMADPVSQPDVPDDPSDPADDGVGSGTARWTFGGLVSAAFNEPSVDIDSDTGTVRVVGYNLVDSVEFIAAYSRPTDSDFFPAVIFNGMHVLVVNGTRHEFDPNEIQTILISAVENVTLAGSNDDDTLVSTPDTVTLDGQGYSVVATGADDVLVYGTGGKNVASLYDSTGDDVFTAGPGSSTIEYASGNTVQVDHFGFVHAYSKAGGNDTASLYDSDGNDYFKGVPTYGKLVYEDETLVRAKFFDVVHAYAKAGGNDVARFEDSAGNDTFIAKPTFAKMKFDGGAFIRAKFFDAIHAYAKAGGQDTARFTGSAGDDLFYGSPGVSRLEAASGVTLRAELFDRVFAHGGKGSDDRAFLYDSESIDVLEADGNHAGLTTTAKDGGKIGHLLRDFDFVKATASTPGDISLVGQRRPVEFDLELAGPWRKKFCSSRNRIFYAACRPGWD